MSDNFSVHQRFEAALDAFVERARADRHVLAVILFGSMSHDRVWEKSDIDLMIITRDDKDLLPGDEDVEGAALLEMDVNIHASLMPRSRFKKMVEGNLQSSFEHAAFAQSCLIYTHDETIQALYEDILTLRAADRRIQLFRSAASVLPILYKAEKWYHVRQDMHYSFIWIMQCVTALAQIEVFRHSQIAGREVIQQALTLNPPFFKAIYTDLIDLEKTPAIIESVLKQISQYLEDDIQLLFQPVLDYLAEEGSVRSVTEISTHFANHYNLEGVTTVCEWLADKGIITKVSTPMRLTTKSNVQYEEMAFYHADF